MNIARMTIKPKRQPPKVATINKHRALSNLNRKLHLLRSWVENGVPTIEETGNPDYFPKTVRQFNLWDGTQNTTDLAVAIERNANDTLRKHVELRSAVERALALLQLRATEQLQNRKNLRIGRLQTALSLQKQMRQTLEEQLIILRKELKAEKSERERSARRLAGQMNELKTELQRLLTENHELKIENASLISTAAKVKPIRQVLHAKT